MYATVHKTQSGLDFDTGKCCGFSGFEVVAIAASAGGIAPLKELLFELPQDFPCPILVVQHLPPAIRYDSQLDLVLRRCTKLQVKWAEREDTLCPGTVLLAPQDHHLQIRDTKNISLVRGPRVNGSRPAADPLFTSMAANFGPKAIAILLSGASSDGARGAGDVAAAGGRVFVQDRRTADVHDMPLAAVRAGAVDFDFSPRILAHTLIALTMAPGAAAWFQVFRKRTSVLLANQNLLPRTNQVVKETGTVPELACWFNYAETPRG